MEKQEIYMSFFDYNYIKTIKEENVEDGEYILKIEGKTQLFAIPEKLRIHIYHTWGNYYNMKKFDDFFEDNEDLNDLRELILSYWDNGYRITNLEISRQDYNRLRWLHQDIEIEHDAEECYWDFSKLIKPIDDFLPAGEYKCYVRENRIYIKHKLIVGDCEQGKIYLLS